MKRNSITRATLIGAGLLAMAMAAQAAPADYSFEAVQKDVKNGAGSELAVRLVHKPSGKPVVGAVIFRTRLAMSRDHMEGIIVHAPPVSAADGVYRFKADLSMAGQWAFKLMAKVPGEAETIQASVVFVAKD